MEDINEKNVLLFLQSLRMEELTDENKNSIASWFINHGFFPFIENKLKDHFTIKHLHLLCKLLVNLEPTKAGVLFDEIMAYTITLEFRGIEKKDGIFAFQNLNFTPFAFKIRNIMYKKNSQTDLKCISESELNELNKILDSDKFFVASAVRHCGSAKEFVSDFIKPRDNTCVLLPDSRAGPDCIFFTSPEAIWFIGCKTSATDSVSNTKIKENAQSTTLDRLYNVNGGEDREDVLKELFSSKNPVKFLFRVHIVLPPTEERKNDDKTPETNFDIENIFVRKLPPSNEYKNESSIIELKFDMNVWI